VLFGNPDLYELVRAAKLGKARLPHPLDALRLWASEQYAINVLYINFDKIPIGPHEGRPRLDLIVETESDFASVHESPFTPQPEVQDGILQKFSELVASSNCHETCDTNNVLLIFDDFSAEAMGQATQHFLQRDKQKALRTFAQHEVWEISGFSKSIVVFYMADNDVRANAANGSSDRIKKQCFEMVKRYDEFAYFHLNNFPITFDSKENLDKNYAGSLFNYFR
jgi:hypothetical protein